MTFTHVPCDFVSIYLFVLTFAMKLKSAIYKSHWNVLVFCDQSRIMSDLNMSHGKMPDFVSFPLPGITLVIKLRNFDFESHWNTLILDIVSDLNMSHGKMSDFVSVPLFGFTLVIKSRNFDFDFIKMTADLIISCQTVSHLV